MSEKQIEIRYAETDQMGVIYHANYIIWMEKNKTLIYEGGVTVKANHKKYPNLMRNRY
ncbi:hypothetical protein [Lysinibacillus fusiformis]|uniref:hypothetical protein n=1 Tax=Lysinibacillus fusiformis TaxID=28031 RepID=UPI00158788CA|nr:hypothetical protein [Lysinibacillus fusiformis]